MPNEMTLTEYVALLIRQSVNKHDFSDHALYWMGGIEDPTGIETSLLIAADIVSGIRNPNAER
jgi:hypothetical protein